MGTRVITPPAPVVAPEDISGVQAGDTAVEAMIAAVTATIDGPFGWLGRALGLQTLEKSLDGFYPAIYLPCPPVVDIVSVTYLDGSGARQTLPDDQYRIDSNGYLSPAFGASWPPFRCDHDSVLIRYRAGYNGEDVAIGGTGDVPAQARQAIILSVQHMRSMSKDDLFLRVDEVDGIGRREFTVSDQASNIIENACSRLLQGLRVYS